MVAACSADDELQPLLLAMAEWVQGITTAVKSLHTVSWGSDSCRNCGQPDNSQSELKALQQAVKALKTML